MKTLLAVELRRFTSRRTVRGVAAAAVLLVVVGASLAFVFSNRNIEAATARERARATADYQDCLAGNGHDGEPCGDEPDLASIHADPRVHLSGLGDLLANLSANLIFAGLALGATFVGAEWHHRTMTVALTWDPRRVRVGIAKIAACSLVVFAGAIAVQVLLSVALVPAAVFRGTMEGTTPAWFGHVVGIGVRGAVIAGFAASLGAALALVARSTAFAIGISFLWLAVVEGILRGVRPGWGPWLIGNNAAGFIGLEANAASRSVVGSGLLLSVYIAGIAALAVASFRRRDVA
jgi:hypothetical protein